jgi:hypothetical protein
MKSLSFRLIPAAAMSVACMIAFSSCDKKESGGGGSSSGGGASAASGAVSEADAIANLKKATEEMAAFKKKGDEAQAANPMAAIPMMREMISKASNLPTNGLPADLKAGVEKANALFKKFGDTILPAFKDIPNDEKGAAAWAEGLKADPTKAQALMATMAEIGPKMQAMEPEKDALKAELEPLLKKYNLPTDFMAD